MRSKSDLPPAIDLPAQPWLRVATANDRKRVQELREYLDFGEAEAIVLAIELRADLLLVDERRGRRAASAAGLAITGLLRATQPQSFRRRHLGVSSPVPELRIAELTGVVYLMGIDGRNVQSISQPRNVPA